MPYIKPDEREELDPVVAKLLSRLGTVGELNYVITKLCLGFANREMRYHNLNAVVGVLECAKLELYRRLVAKYEDEKAKENGDVYE